MTLILFPAAGNAAYMFENIFQTGSGAYQNDSVTFYADASERFILGLGGEYYKNALRSSDGKVYSVHLPLSYSANKYLFGIKPFFYPNNSETQSRAFGSNLYVERVFQDLEIRESERNPTSVIMNMAFASESALVSGEKKNYQEYLLEAKVKKDFYKLWTLSAGAGAFSLSGDGVSNGKFTVAPSLDHNKLLQDRLNMGVLTAVTELPDWYLSSQVTRTMEPGYDGDFVFGYSQIHLRDSEYINSLTAGMNLELNDTTTFNVSYDLFKHSAISHYKHYANITLRIVF